jgi:hypothetical protein
MRLRCKEPHNTRFENGDIFSIKSPVMREIEFTALQLQQAFVQLQQGLETNATGRLSSVLIPPYNLSKILQEVTLRLPHVSLIAASDIDNMYVYYNVAAVQAYATPTAIRLAVSFPLRGPIR